MSKLGDVLFGFFLLLKKTHVFSGGFDAWKNVAKAVLRVDVIPPVFLLRDKVGEMFYNSEHVNVKIVAKPFATHSAS